MWNANARRSERARSARRSIPRPSWPSPAGRGDGTDARSQSGVQRTEGGARPASQARVSAFSRELRANLGSVGDGRGTPTRSAASGLAPPFDPSGFPRARVPRGPNPAVDRSPSVVDSQAEWSFAGGSWRWHGRPIAIRRSTDGGRGETRIASARLGVLPRAPRKSGIRRGWTWNANAQRSERARSDRRSIPRPSGPSLAGRGDGTEIGRASGGERA